MLARDMSDWVWQGERGMLRSFDGSTAEANAAARALSDEVTAARFTEVADVVPGARTVLVELVPGTEPSGGLTRARSRRSTTAARRGTQARDRGHVRR